MNKKYIYPRNCVGFKKKKALKDILGCWIELKYMSMIDMAIIRFLQMYQLSDSPIVIYIGMLWQMYLDDDDELHMPCAQFSLTWQSRPCHGIQDAIIKDIGHRTWQIKKCHHVTKPLCFLSVRYRNDEIIRHCSIRYDVCRLLFSCTLYLKKKFADDDICSSSSSSRILACLDWLFLTSLQ